MANGKHYSGSWWCNDCDPGEGFEVICVSTLLTLYSLIIKNYHACALQHVYITQYITLLVHTLHSSPLSYKVKLQN